MSAKIIATAAVSGRSSGRIECAAQPASSARARVAAEASRGAPWSPAAARAARSGPCGAGAAAGAAGRGDRRAARAARAGTARRACGTRRRPRRGRARCRRASAAAAPPARRRAGARPTRADWIQRSPCASRSRLRKNGERIPIGWQPEQTSWRKPGSVSAAVRVPPPISSRPSRTRTDAPLRASSTAAASPFGPEPTTTASSMLSTAVVPGGAPGEVGELARSLPRGARAWRRRCASAASSRGAAATRP